MEIWCHWIIFIKHRFWKIHELETFGTRKRILSKNKLEECSYARKRPVVFWNFHTFFSFFSRELFLVAVHGWFAIQINVWKVQNTTGRFLSQLRTSIFFSSNPFPSAKSFQFMTFSEAMFYENYLTSDFHTNTVISILFAYSSKWRRKPW